MMNNRRIRIITGKRKTCPWIFISFVVVLYAISLGEDWGLILEDDPECEISSWWSMLLDKYTYSSLSLSSVDEADAAAAVVVAVVVVVVVVVAVAASDG